MSQRRSDQTTEHNFLVCLDLRLKSDLTQQETFPKYVHSVPNASIYTWCDQVYVRNTKYGGFFPSVEWRGNYKSSMRK